MDPKSKTLSECPNCGSTDLQQEFQSRAPASGGRIGGEHHSQPATTSGSSCNSCGILLKFDKKGKCPICEGTGKEIHKTFRGFTEVHRRESTCSRCKGEKVI